MKRLPPIFLLSAAFAVLGSAQTNPYIQITTPSPLPTGYVGIAYSDFFRANTYQAGLPVAWSLVSSPSVPATGAPPGVFLNGSTGEFSGTPTTAGTYTFIVQAQIANTSAPPDTEAFTITIGNPTISITSPAGLPNGTIGVPYSVTLTATSNPSGVIWLPTEGLPPGLNLNQNGQITGTPTQAGAYTFAVFAQIANTNISTSASVTISVFSGQLSIANSSLPVAYAGQSYSATLNANVAGVTWALSSGSFLPAGMTLIASTGVISGASSAVGAYPLTVQATLANYAPATQNLTLYVASAPLGIVESSIPIAIQGAPYHATLTPLGGLAPYTWSFAPGANAQGLSIDPKTGAITGTPPNLGSFTLPVQLSDMTNAAPFVRAFVLIVAAPLSVTTSSLLPGTPQASYSQTLAAGGGQAPFTWALAPNSTPLPPGLTLSAGGVISGTIAFNATGVYSFVVQVTDVGARTATKTLSIAIAVTLTITTSSLPDGVVGATYSQTLAASGGTQPYTWTLVSGQLPAGLTLDGKTGAISGTPTAAGSSPFTVQAADSTPGSALTAQSSLTLTIDTALSITTTAALPGGTVGAAYSVTLQATGGKPSYKWSLASGALPAGLSLNTSTGAIGGTPSAAGTSTFTAAVADSGSQSVQRQFSIAVSAATSPISITTGNLSATVGVAFSQTLAATGGASPYSFALTSGTLPAGLTFTSSSATISGTPTAAGSSSVVFTATDANNQAGSKTIIITVSLPTPPSVTIGVGSGATPVGPAQQVPVNITLGSSFPVDITVALTLTFQSSVGGDDQTVQFITAGGGTRNLTLTIPAGSLSPPAAPMVATGTVAGTITINTQLTAPGATFPSQPPITITIAKTAPVIQSVAFSNTGGSLTVTVTGYSTTRDMVSGDFNFTPATGSTLAQSDVQVQLGPPFSTWYQNTASNAFGGQFKLTMPFSVSGNSANVITVVVKLTNSAGTSTGVSPP